MSDLQLFVDSIKSDSDEKIKNKFNIEYPKMKEKDSWNSSHYACYGKIDSIKSLQFKYCQNLCQSIHVACENGYIDIAKILIDNKCDINASENGYQPIHLACKNGHIDIVKILIDNKCDINSFDYNGYQSIHLASENGYIDIVKLLIDNKCNINTFGDNGYQPIHLACKNGHIDIVKILISQKCDIENKDKINGYHPIHLACMNGYIDIVKILFANKCDIILCAQNGYQPIHLACKNGHIDIVKLLIDNKCDINTSNKGGYQPIHLACENPNIEIVKILIANKCDINSSIYNGYQPIHFVCENGHIGIVKILIDNKYDINATDKNRCQPIHLACLNGHIGIVKILIDNKCDINATDKWGQQPIDLACKNNHMDVMKILLLNIFGITILSKIERVAAAMNLQCTTKCDHRFCRRTLNQNELKKGELIGSGPFGKVYKYKISNSNQQIVIKQTKFDNGDKKNIERNINKFSTEIRHRNIVRYFGALEKSGKLCIFMEYMPGNSLKDHIDKKGSIEMNKVITYIKQILNGLQFLHSKKIIHRDIKPGNILLDYDDTLKIADFGISRSLQKSFTVSMELAKTFCGTPNYMAPEIFLGEPYNYPADIWSTGATVIHMITGKMPYHNYMPEVTMFKIGTTRKIEFTHCQELSETMQSFINDLLTPEQVDRPTAKDLLKHSVFM